MVMSWAFSSFSSTPSRPSGARGRAGPARAAPDGREIPFASGARLRPLDRDRRRRRRFLIVIQRCSGDRREFTAECSPCACWGMGSILGTLLGAFVLGLAGVLHFHLLRSVWAPAVSFACCSPRSRSVLPAARQMNQLDLSRQSPLPSALDAQRRNAAHPERIFLYGRLHRASLRDSRHRGQTSLGGYTGYVNFGSAAFFGSAPIPRSFSTMHSSAVWWLGIVAGTWWPASRGWSLGYPRCACAGCSSPSLRWRSPFVLYISS